METLLLILVIITLVLSVINTYVLIDNGAFTLKKRRADFADEVSQAQRELKVVLDKGEALLKSIETQDSVEMRILKIRLLTYRAELLRYIAYFSNLSDEQPSPTLAQLEASFAELFKCKAWLEQSKKELDKKGV